MQLDLNKTFIWVLLSWMSILACESFLVPMSRDEVNVEELNQRLKELKPGTDVCFIGKSSMKVASTVFLPAGVAYHFNRAQVWSISANFQGKAVFASTSMSQAPGGRNTDKMFVKVQELTIDGTLSPDNVDGLVLRVSESIVADCVFLMIKGNGVVFRHTSWNGHIDPEGSNYVFNRLEGCRFRGIKGTAFATEESGNKITDGWVTGNAFTSVGTGVEIRSCQGWKISQNQFSNMNYGIRCNRYNHTTITENIFHYVNGKTDGAGITITPSMKTSNIIVTNNIVEVIAEKADDRVAGIWHLGGDVHEGVLVKDNVVRVLGKGQKDYFRGLDGQWNRFQKE